MIYDNDDDDPEQDSMPPLTTDTTRLFLIDVLWEIYHLNHKNVDLVTKLEMYLQELGSQSTTARMFEIQDSMLNLVPAYFTD